MVSLVSGKRLFPDQVDSPTIGDVLTHDSESGYECAAGALVDGRWFAFEVDAGIKIFDSPQAVAKWLWRNGPSHFGLLQLLARMGWLTLNTKALAEAQSSGRIVDGCRQ